MNPIRAERPRLLANPPLLAAAPSFATASWFAAALALTAALLLGAPLAWTAPAAAGTPTPTDTLRTLVDGRQFEQAYSLGSTIQLEYEGSPSFDFYFGLSALETGHYQDAAFALERAAISRPDSRAFALSWPGRFF